MATRRAILGLILTSTLLAGASGCRADDAECVALADHVVALATAAGKPTSGTAAALEQDCKRLRPTRTLVQCMMDAQSLDDLDAC
ncbi:hypothetical protein ACNOYE_22535 [Nannocystaceae bacterium ST9]